MLRHRVLFYGSGIATGFLIVMGHWVFAACIAFVALTGILIGAFD